MKTNGELLNKMASSFQSKYNSYLVSYRETKFPIYRELLMHMEEIIFNHPDLSYKWKPVTVKIRHVNRLEDVRTIHVWHSPDLAQKPITPLFAKEKTTNDNNTAVESISKNNVQLSLDMSNYAIDFETKARYKPLDTNAYRYDAIEVEGNVSGGIVLSYGTIDSVYVYEYLTTSITTGIIELRYIPVAQTVCKKKNALKDYDNIATLLAALSFKLI